MTFGGHVLAFFRELAVVVVGAIVVASVLRAFVGQMFVIPSISMADTLAVDDRVLVEKLSSLQRGQVVVFEDPGDWVAEPLTVPRGRVGEALEFVGLLPDAGTDHLIKRVVGLPGDRVVCCDTQGRITVNGQPLDESTYATSSYAGSGSGDVRVIRFDVTVPAGRVFVLGDNRSNSRDSRCHLNDQAPGTGKGDNAFVSTDLVVGRAVAVVWPLSRADRLQTPDTFLGLPVGQSPAPATAAIDAGPEASC